MCHYFILGTDSPTDNAQMEMNGQSDNGDAPDARRQVDEEQKSPSYYEERSSNGNPNEVGAVVHQVQADVLPAAANYVNLQPEDHTSPQLDGPYLTLDQTTIVIDPPPVYARLRNNVDNANVWTE